MEMKLTGGWIVSAGEIRSKMSSDRIEISTDGISGVFSTKFTFQRRQLSRMFLVIASRPARRAT